jgi:hypothetical protein
MTSLLLTPAVRADTWVMPSPVTVMSSSNNFIAQVLPGHGGFGHYEHAITNREQNATAVVSVGRPGAATNLVWQGKLVNPAAPVEVYVSDTGGLVTLDNWHNVGYGPIVVIYDPTGRLVRYWELKDLYTFEEQMQLKYTVSSIWWHTGKAHFGVGTETNTFIVPTTHGAFVFDTIKGTLLSSPSRNVGPAPDDKHKEGH